MLTLLKKNPRFPSSEYRQFAKLRIACLIIFGTLILGIGSGTFFIYNNIFFAIEQTQSIIILKSKLSIEIIDFQFLEQIKNKWEEKHSGSAPLITRDPFNPVIIEEKHADSQ